MYWILSGSWILVVCKYFFHAYTLMVSGVSKEMLMVKGLLSDELIFYLALKTILIASMK